MHPHDPIAAALDHCLSAPTAVPPLDSVDQWWPGWAALAAQPSSPMALALLGGFAADRVGWAFAAGYQSALRSLVPSLPVQALAAFCVTEEGGNRPRDIRTLITPGAGGGFHVSGSKRWTTLGPQGTLLLVTGRLAGAATDERPSLKVALVRADQPGVTVVPMPETAFVPEVPHARIQLQDVAIEASSLLPGDGYDTYVKPFRTLEDSLVTAAVLAYLLREARARGWPADLRERLAATLITLAAVAQSHREAPTTHIALAGALHWAAALYHEAGALWAETPDDPASRRWLRDAPLFSVAAGARQQRAARAWEQLQA
jgi:acyl-CoA dehydrogenase